MKDTDSAIDARLESALDTLINTGRYGRVVDPYASARHYVDELSHARRGQNTVLKAVCTASLALAGYALWSQHDVAKHGDYRTAIVAVDRFDRSYFVGWAEPATQIDVPQAAIEEKLRSFVEAWRSLSSDGATNKRNSNYVGAMVPESRDYPSRRILSEWYFANDPGVRAKDSIVTVEVTRIWPVGQTNTWIVEWIETEKNSDGTVKAGWPRTYTSELVVGREAAPSDQKMRLNPLRIMVTELRWKQIN